MSAATVFATWFGAETVLSVSATFAKDGLGGVVADPFGSSFCLLFVALFFARAFYRMDLLTIGDFYHKRYNKPVELISKARPLARTLTINSSKTSQCNAESQVSSICHRAQPTVSTADATILRLPVDQRWTIFT